MWFLFSFPIGLFSFSAVYYPSCLTLTTLALNGITVEFFRCSSHQTCEPVSTTELKRVRESVRACRIVWFTRDRTRLVLKPPKNSSSWRRLVREISCSPGAHTYVDAVGAPTVRRGPETGFALDGNGSSATNGKSKQVSPRVHSFETLLKCIPHNNNSCRTRIVLVWRVDDFFYESIEQSKNRFFKNNWF